MIKEILDEISSTSSKNEKQEILAKYKDNELLKRVLYLANSPRVKFWIKKIPDFQYIGDNKGLEWGLDMLEPLMSRELRGGAAINHVRTILGGVNQEHQDIISKIIKKDLKIGMDKSINKVIPNLIEETPYMGAKSFSEKTAKKLFDPKNDKTVYSQVKMDGTYRNAIIDNGVVTLLSRKGEISYLEGTTFLKELKFFEDCVLNGELTIDGFERYEANGMVTSIIDIKEKEPIRQPKETEKAINKFEKKHGCTLEHAMNNMRFTLWDVIDIDEYDSKKSNTPYYQRLDRLRGMLTAYAPNPDSKLSIVETKEVITYKEAIEHFLDTQKRGLEGTIIKSYDGGWKDGKPSHQLKMKLEMTLDLKITGFLYGNEGTKNEHVISRLKVETSDGLLKTQPSGMKEKEMEMVTENQDNLLGTIVEVKCSGLSQDEDGAWSLLHPSVVEFRSDKDTCDSLESAKEIEEMAKTLEKN